MFRHRIAFVLGLIVSLSFASAHALGEEPVYNPLSVPAEWKPETHDLPIDDSSRKRNIPIRVFLPREQEPAAVVLFSHGLGGDRTGSAYLGKHWSARGFVVVMMQHIGSDDSVWKDIPRLQRPAALKKAANLQNTLLRLGDVPAVIDQLELWNADKKSVLHGRLDLARLGMSGHSFGAVTTQGVSGQKTTQGTGRYTEKRIKAALAMSPNSPKNGGDPKRLFGDVTIPWLLMTGTEDIAAVGDATVESRLSVFPALPSGGKYELVLHAGEHHAFSDRDLPGSKNPRNPNHHRAILAISTAFWDAYLNENVAARNWLDGDGPKLVLEKKDRWQKK